MSTVVAACVAVASAEAAEPADTITNRASLILCFLPTAMAAFVCSDGDGGRSGDSGGGGGRRLESNGALMNSLQYSRLVSDFSRTLTTARTISLSVCQSVCLSVYVCQSVCQSVC